MVTLKPLYSIKVMYTVYQALPTQWDIKHHLYLGLCYSTILRGANKRVLFPALGSWATYMTTNFKLRIFNFLLVLVKFRLWEGFYSASFFETKRYTFQKIKINDL